MQIRFADALSKKTVVQKSATTIAQVLLQQALAETGLPTFATPPSSQVGCSET
jgi:hypothetical protein